MNKATVLLPTVYGFTEIQPYSLGALSLGSALYHSDLLPYLTIRLIGVLDRTAHPQSLADSIANEAPDIIGLGVYIWNEHLIEEALPLIRARLPEALIILGGLSVLHATRTFASSFSAADLFVMGEGEEVLISIVRAFLSRPRGEAIRQSAELIGVMTRDALGTLPSSPAAVPVENYRSPYLTYDRSVSFFDSIGGDYSYVWWELSRGCVYTCSFCAFDSQRLGCRCVEQSRIQAELEVLRRNTVRHVFVTDAIFGGTKTAALETLRSLARQPLTWSDRRNGVQATHVRAYFRPEMIDEEYAGLLSAARISLVQIGLQTTNPAVEPTIRQNNLKMVANGARHFRRCNLPTLVDLIVGCPGDDLRGLKESIRFVVEEIQPLAFRAYPLTVIPGTALAAMAQQRGSRWLDCDVTTKVVTSSVSFTNTELREMDAYATVAVAIYNYARDSGVLGDWRHELMDLFDLVAGYCLEARTGAASRLKFGHQRSSKGKDVVAVMRRLGRQVPSGTLIERCLYGNSED